MKIQLSHKFEDIINFENLLEAWREFVKGKTDKGDVQEFSFHLADNIFALNRELANKTYRHGGYKAFNICDPNLEISIKRPSETDYCITRFTEFCIRFLIKHL